MLNKITPQLVRLVTGALLLASCALLPQARAAVVSDDFSKGTNSNDWSALGYACLTARNSNATGDRTAAGGSNIPGCNTSPEASGSGALRLTNNGTSQRGAIVSNYTFPTNQGLQVTFTTYTFGGDSGGTGHLGADGMSFFLMDGAVGTTLGTGNVSNLGGSGGALSYSCSNGNSDYSGVTGAYLGLGMDEYGNFLNKGDNTTTGIAAQTAAGGNNGFNSWGSGTYQSNRIGLRGAGNVSWYWLNLTYPTLFPSSFNGTLRQSAVQATCKSGFVWDFRNAVSQSITTASVSGNTLSLTMPSTVGYSNGDSVSLGGTITATAVTKNIASSPAPSYTGTTLTFTGTGGTYSVGQTVTLGGTITATPAGQSIASYSDYSSSGGVKQFRININTASGGSTGSFATGNTVFVSGITGTTAYPNNRSYVVAGVSASSNPPYILVTCPSALTCTTTYPTIGSGVVTLGTAASGTAVSLSGTSYITANGTTGSTIKVTLPTTIQTITNTSGTVSLPVPTVTGSGANLVVSNLSGTGFDVTLNYPAASITNTTGNVVGNGHQTTTQVQDYDVIPGGYYVLPENQPIAIESATTRATATPVTYKLTITPSGSLNFLYSYNGGAFQQVLTNWPITANNGALPSTFRFGFTGATGGSTNYHDITCFLAEPVTSASGSGGNSVQAGQFRNSTQVYTASYDSYFWSGSVTAVPIALSSVTEGALVLGTATWDGNCVLTGGGCATTGVALGTPASRQILTWDPTALSGVGSGIPLAWASLTTAQKAILNSTDSQGSNRVDWLRGDRSQEQSSSSGGTLRARTGVLGDVVDSSPTWVGPPTLNYGKSALPDSLYGASAISGNETSHAAFNTTMAQRLNMVYVGSNDGLLHGFRSGTNNTDGTYNSTNNDGQEMIAFMPSSVLTTSDVVSLTRSTYGHAFFVDAPPGYGDLYYGGAWHTWLVGGMGPGGKEIFALDITDPTGDATSSLAFSQTNAANLVKGDWTAATLTSCVNATTGCGNNLGNTYGTPLVRRLHNGQWAIIFGNGYGSANNRAGVFIGLVNPLTSGGVAAGTVSFYWLDTGVTSGNANGIAYVSSADLDGDHVTDYLYAGDLLGKLWRFDLTSSNPADWAASKFGQTNATPLFDAGTGQPITTQITTTVVAMTGLGTRVMLGFGTGKANAFTSATAVTYVSGTQSIYGVWDWDMTAWNTVHTTAAGVVIPASSVKYAALTAPQTIAKTNLKPFTVVQTAATQTQEATRKVAVSNGVCWQGSLACPTATNTSTSNSQYGWYLDLPSTGEQLIYSPGFESGALVVNTTIPPGTGAVGQCTPVATTGWTLAINMGNGGGFKQNVFADASGSYTPGTDGSIIGVQMNLVGKSSILTVSNKRAVAGSSSSGIVTGRGVNLVGGLQVKRVSWEQIR